ncbi:YlaI family protein [Bacillus sp. FJAT-50079]|uniref:YlaI family protein n=1 Tax=Bacillus sp. FJAT-50079 TaxID=2833577 RepID=UPI001BC9E18F|nr:YlaI family protein [Bacillus sp. FJAT-50079]MBS4207762.1 YlaI family protein [Bacillus sp. FJAT-50079]
MRVQCVICDQQSTLEDHSPIAKKLRNRPIHTFMCDTCHARIKENTEARLAKNTFQLYSYNNKDRDF